MRTIKWLIFLTVICAAGFAVWYFGFKKDKSTVEVAPKIETVKKQDIELSVNCNGKIISNLDVEIKSKASGQIIKIPHDISDRIKKGDLLVELDPIDEQRRVEQAEANRLSAEAKLITSKENLKIAEHDLKLARINTMSDSSASFSKLKTVKSKAQREKELLEKGLSSQEEYDAAVTAADQAEADYQSAVSKVKELKSQEMSLEIKRQSIRQAESDYNTSKINLADAKERLKETKIYATMDGVITDRTVQTGQIVSSGISNVGGGSSLMILSDLSKMFVSASVDESEIGKIHIGQKARITVDAFQGKTFEGKVTQIAARGYSASNVVTFDVKIEVNDKNKDLLKPEMTANVDIITASSKDALVIPVEAVLSGSRKENNNKSRVLVVKGEGKPIPTPVELGISNGFIIEVKSGLSENDKILIKTNGGSSRWSKDGNNNRNTTRALRHAARTLR